jgi:hypothetical protein
LTAEKLRRLTRDVAKARQDGPGGGEQAVFTGSRRELTQAWAQGEAALHVTRDQSVVLERDSKSVSRRARKTRGCDETGQ